MAEIKVPIQVNLPDDWVEQIVNRLRNDPDAEWVEVTRCRDCRFNDGTAYCEFHFRDVKGDDYCSWAERKTDGQCKSD